jgi:hypothetical protein
MAMLSVVLWLHPAGPESEMTPASAVRSTSPGVRKVGNALTRLAFAYCAAKNSKF